MNQYRILRQLRKSNWIQSYLAIEKERRRQVVLKFVVHPQAQASDWHNSFQQRLAAVQRLSQQQPNLPLAAIYEWGRLSDPYEAGEETIPAGAPYFVLEYIEGESLADMQAEFSIFPMRLASDIVDTIAATLDKIHAAGLTHGNLKPSNILIGADDELVLTDFHLTPSGGFLMNVGEQLTQDEAAYVSPEQTQSARAVNQRSDIYNLGLLLFEMVTGERPFRGPSISRLLRQHAFDAPPSARRLNSELPAAVDPILEKALAKNDLARYETAGEMAAALRQVLAETEAAAAPPPPIFPPPVVVPVTSMAPDPLTTVTVMEQVFLEDEPPVKPKAESSASQASPASSASQASPASPASQASPTAAGRRPTPSPPASQGKQTNQSTSPRPAVALIPIVIVAGAVVIVSACILILALLSFREMSAPPETSVAEATLISATPANGESLSLEELLLGSLDQSLPASGPQALIEISRYGEGKVEAINVVPQGAAVAVSGPAGVALYDMTDLSLIERPFSDPTKAIAWLDDGRLLAIASRESSVSVINIWDNEGRRRQQLSTGEYSGITEMAAPESGDQLAVLQAGNLQIWSTPTEATTGQWLFEPQTARHLSWSPNGDRIAVALDNQTVQIINTQSEAIILTLEGGDFNIVAMAWSPNAAYLAGVTGGGQMTVWATADGGVISRRRGVGAVSWTGDGRYLLGGSQDGQIIFWDTTDSDNQWQISKTWPTEDEAAIVWLHWLNDPPRLLSWNEEGWLRLRDGASGDLLAERGHFNASLYNAVSDLAWSPDGGYLAASSWDATIRIWQTNTLTVSQILRDHRSYIGPVDWSPDGEWIASGSIDGGGTLRLRALNEEDAITIPVDEDGPPRSLAFSPDGRWLAVGLESGALLLRSMPPNPSEIILSGTAADDRISALAWSPNSQQLTAVSRSGTVTVWQIPGGTLLQQWRIEEAAFDMVVAWSPTEPVIAVARSMSEIELWSSDNWSLIRTIAGVPGVSVNQIAYSPDGRWLAMVGGRENVIVFSTATGEVAYVGMGHAAAVRSVVWSPTSPNHLASGGDDGVIRLWLLPEGQPGR